MALRDPADDPRLARERMTTLAAELARRSSKDHLEAEALAAAEDLEVRAKAMAQAKATEVKDELKQRARAATVGRVERAMDSAGRAASGLAHDVKEQAMGNSTGSIVGAVAGATAGVVVARQLQKRRETVPPTIKGQAYGYGYGYGPGISELGTTSRSVEGAAPPAVRSGAQGFVRAAVDEQPLLLALGALVLGGIAGLLVPVSPGERRAFEPLKSKAVEGVQKLGDVLQGQLDQSAQPPAQENTERTSTVEPAFASKLGDLHELDDVPEESVGERPRGILDDLSHNPGSLH